jgi:hypothetical protein
MAAYKGPLTSPCGSHIFWSTVNLKRATGGLGGWPPRKMAIGHSTTLFLVWRFGRGLISWEISVQLGPEIIMEFDCTAGHMLQLI